MAIEEIVSELHKNGFYKFQTPLISNEVCENLKSLLKPHLEKADDDYLFGKAARVGPYQAWRPTAVYDLFSSPLVQGIARGFYGHEPSFNEIFATHEFRNDQGLERNGFLHFDRIPTLKFFLYLTPVDRNCGAFNYVPGSYQLGKQLRTASNAETDEYGKIKNRLEIDFPDLGYTKQNAVPVEGDAGTMFIFHSDLFHYGGTIESGREREIVRLHVRP
jgi:hypothetical protein